MSSHSQYSNGKDEKYDPTTQSSPQPAIQPLHNQFVCPADLELTSITGQDSQLVYGNCSISHDKSSYPSPRSALQTGWKPVYSDQQYKPALANNKNTERTSIPSGLHTRMHLSHNKEILSVPDEVKNHIPTGTSVLEPRSILDISGRTYQACKEDEYFLPNDPVEQDRLDLQHASFLNLLKGKLACAPIKSPKYVLDVGTETGIWAIDFADQYPDAYVIGTDLSQIQPPNAPPNCEFIKDDSEEEYIFPHYRFDYVHFRLMYTCLDDTRKLIKNAFDNLTEGGWIEFQHASCQLSSNNDKIKNNTYEKWSSLCVKGAASIGRDVLVSRHYKKWLIEAGFVDVVERKLKLPVGSWPSEPSGKALGNLTRANLVQAIRGFGWKMLSHLRMRPAEIEQLTKNVLVDVWNDELQASIPVWIVYGRKPFKGETVKLGNDTVILN